jgi:hypothetical protein
MVISMTSPTTDGTGRAAIFGWYDPAPQAAFGASAIAGAIVVPMKKKPIQSITRLSLKRNWFLFDLTSETYPSLWDARLPPCNTLNSWDKKGIAVDDATTHA